MASQRPAQHGSLGHLTRVRAGRELVQGHREQWGAWVCKPASSELQVKAVKAGGWEGYYSRKKDMG
eukprot:1158586-Pelagomonas_calceolata.AAC.3